MHVHCRFREINIVTSHPGHGHTDIDQLFYWTFRSLYATPRASLVDVMDKLRKTGEHTVHVRGCCSNPSVGCTECTKGCRFQVLEDLIDFSGLVADSGLQGKTLRIHGGGVGSRCGSWLNLALAVHRGKCVLTALFG